MYSWYTFQEWALNYWSRKGAPKHKLIVGLGFYGRSFKLENPLNNGLGANSIGAGRMGNYTKEDGFMAYYEVGCIFTYMSSSSVVTCEGMKEL